MSYTFPVPESSWRFRATSSREAAPTMLSIKDSWKEKHMREWHKPTIDETEPGMEVTSYLPAELDRT